MKNLITNHLKVGLFAALTTVLLWASAFPFIRMGLKEFDPIPLAALRFTTAALLMLCWLLWTKPALPDKRDIFRLIVCSVIGLVFYNILLNEGQKTVQAGATSFIVNVVPVLTAILACIFLKESFKLWAWVGTLISFAGVTIIALGQIGGFTLGQGVTLIIAAACCQATFFILLRPLVAKYGAKPCTAYQAAEILET